MITYEHITERIFLLHDFLSADECRDWIALSESIGYTDAPITTHGGPVMMPEVRNNERVILDDSARADWLYERARPWLPESLGGCPVVGMNDRLRFYRYDPGQRFNWHLDGYFERDSGEKSRLTFMIYLNDGFLGGQTDFGHNRDIPQHRVEPRAGTALVFIHQQLHRGSTVAEGRKYVLRTDVMYGLQDQEPEPIDWQAIQRQR